MQVNSDEPMVQAVRGQLSVVRCQLIGALKDFKLDALMRTAFEKLRVYRLSEKLADQLWDVATNWNNFAKSTVGIQLVRSGDSFGANIAEGTGRGSYQDNRRFVRTARGSLNETQHWLRRAYRRKLLTSEQVDALKPLIDELAPRLSAYLKSIGPTKDEENS